MSNPIMKQILKNAGIFRKAAKKKNPMKGTALPPGDYIAIVRKATLAEFSKGEDKIAGVKFDIVAVCSKEGVQEDIIGEPCQIICRFAETQNQTMEQAIDRFFFTLQDMDLDTSKLNTDQLDSELEQLNTQIFPLYILININMSKDGAMKNVNVRGVPSPDVLASFGLDPDSPALPEVTEGSNEQVEEQSEEQTEEEQVEEQAEEEVASEYDFPNMSRNEVKKLNVELNLGVKVFPSMSDDDVRNAVAEAYAASRNAPFEEEPEEPEEEEEVPEEEAVEEEPAPKAPPRKAPVKAPAKAPVKKPAPKR